MCIEDQILQNVLFLCIHQWHLIYPLINSSIYLQGTLTPDGTVSVDCGGTQTFTCRAPGVSIGWNIAGLSGISMGPFRARPAARNNPRITSNDTGGNSQVGVSVITISGFSISDNGGNIQCINMDDNSVQGMATISVGEWVYIVRMPGCVMEVCICLYT